jgi:DNA primase
MNEVERILLKNIPDLKENGEELIGLCPFHSDTKPSFGLNTKTGKWHCFGCGEGGDLLKLLELLTGDLIKSSLLISNLELGDYKEAPPPAEIVLPTNDGASKYLENRGYSPHIISKHEVYYNVMRGLIIPVRDAKSKLVGWIERKNGYKYSRGLPKGRTLYNLNNNLLNSSIHVVEGALDAMWLEQSGVPSVATLGAYVTVEQIDLLKKWFKQITVIPDNDEAGINMGVRLNKLLGAKIILPPVENTDIQDYTEEEVRLLCQTVPTS